MRGDQRPVSEIDRDDELLRAQATLQRGFELVCQREHQRLAAFGAAEHLELSPVAHQRLVRFAELPAFDEAHQPEKIQFVERCDVVVDKQQLHRKPEPRSSRDLQGAH